jgi:hypothetical protein
MKATIMLQGMLQMLDFLGEDAIVSIRVKLDTGETVTVPLKKVTSGTQEEGIVLTNVE